MNLQFLQSISLNVAQERDSRLVLRSIVEGLLQESDVALARIWLIAPGDRCDVCRSHAECLERKSCLHLAASAGRPLRSPEENWFRLDGEYSRIPVGARKIGGVAKTGDPVLVSDVSQNWTVREDFAQRESIRSFAAQPLVFRGEILGVLAVFSRAHLQEEHFRWLRTFADHAAVAIAHSRAFEENQRLRERLESENAYLREEIKREPSSVVMAGKSAAFRKLTEQINLVAGTGANVLIQGESGTGKELVARAIHRLSRRKDRPLIRVNCGSIARELFESEFFGHVRGAYTGALRDRLGRFQLADGGTLFLDEVGEIPLDLQSKLLRVLQEGQYERVGEDKTRQVDVRILAATNRDLKQEVKRGHFREDLFYRLNVFPIDVPPLRVRKEDIPTLANDLMMAACRRLCVPECSLDREQLDLLGAHDWPGNIRELQNVLERAVILSTGGRLQLEAFGVESCSDAGGGQDAAGATCYLQHNEFLTEERWGQLERENLLSALQSAHGRVGGPGGAAELLGVRPTTLRSRLKAKGIRYRA